MTGAGFVEKATVIVQQKITDAKNALTGDETLYGTWFSDPIGGRLREIVVEDSGNIVGTATGPEFATHIANHSPDVMVPLWEWMLETLGQWKVIDLNHGPTHLQVQQQIVNALAESLARAFCGGDE